MGLFTKLKDGLEKTRQGFVEKVEQLVTGRKKIDEELFEELEEIMIGADIGVKTTLKLIENLRETVDKQKIEDPAVLKDLLKNEIIELLGTEEAPLRTTEKPTVVMMVGVNGVGKTTTIGKLAYQAKADGKKVLLAAGDTFRAAAIDQLQIWGQRAGCEIIMHAEGADPAAVAYDAVQAARSRGVDMLLIDTAGRLHTKSNLMEELKKVNRVIDKALPGAPHEVLLVLDATTGQNAVQQTKLFSEAVGLTGVVLTKLDGTAKGGVIIAIKDELQIPVKFIGIGEKADDLRKFVPQDFVDALFA